MANNYSKYTAIRVTPTVIAGTTEDNDVMFNATEIPNAVIGKGGCSKLLGITIIDKDGEQVDMDLIFMKVQTNFGTAGSASNITDGNLQAAKVLGALTIDWTDHHVTFAQNANNASVWTSGGMAGTGNNGTTFPILLEAESDSTSVFFTAIVNTASNADYAATDDLEFVFHIERQ